MSYIPLPYGKPQKTTKLMNFCRNHNLFVLFLELLHLAITLTILHFSVILLAPFRIGKICNGIFWLLAR